MTKGIIQDPTKPSERFNDRVGDKIQRAIAGSIVSQYRRAYEYCYKKDALAREEARDLLPHLRRAYIEGIMPDIAARLSGWNAYTAENKAKNCWHRLVIGDGIVISQSKVEERGTLPREAEFRKGYAASPQGVFEFMKDQESAELDDNLTLYCIIVHMPRADDKRVPEFIDIVFPDRDYGEGVDPIKLLEKFPDVVPKERQAAEEVLDKPDIRFLPRIEEIPRA